MMTIRSHDQFNTTIYGLDDRYRGVHNGRRVVFLNAEDIARAGSVGRSGRRPRRATSRARSAPRAASSSCPTASRAAAPPTYFPEANVLVPVGSVADKSNTPASKSVVISVRPSDAPLKFDYDSADGRAAS